MKQPIRVGLAGAGCMGMGIARQIARTPGMHLSWVADTDLASAEMAASFDSSCRAGVSVDQMFDREPVDAFVESTNTIGPALDYCLRAIEERAHLVLMNAEVDLAFGPELLAASDQQGVMMTSDAGDQHGVLASMIHEIELWGFDIVQAGNIKGFLNRYATAEDLMGEAAKRNLNPIQCCAYTDGTKLNIEMAVLANAMGYVPVREGMSGPRASRVEQALDLFDFSKYPSLGVVDYLLGAEPGGGVYVIGRCGDEVQIPYLSYYKLGDGPYYLFYRPYHLCHLETPGAIARVVLGQDAVLQPWAGRVTEVYARAKCDLPAGTKIEHAIGGDAFYGMIDCCSPARVPIALLECEPGGQKPILARGLQKDEPLHWEDVEMPSGHLGDRLAHLQAEL
ncbi:homoserine dehydrogenase [Oceaniferula marina]|nr:homoserine dehydrogenase [Oceaniferula marina]